MREKITILYLDDFKYIGGAEVVLLSLLRNLGKERYNIIVAAPAGDCFEAEIKNAGVKFIPLPFDELKRNYFKIIPILMHLKIIKGIIVNEKVDIVHANSLWTLNFAALALYLKKTPIICSVHAFPRIQSKLKSRIFGFFKKFIIKRTKQFHVVSDSLEKEMIKSGFPTMKLLKIENGVDLNRFKIDLDGKNFRAIESIPKDVFAIGIIGRIHPGKGQGILVDAAKKINAQHPDTHYLIIGEEYVTPLENLRFKDEIKKKLIEFGLEEKFHFIGLKNDIENVIAAIDILTLPSKEETFGLSILEGMAMGKAVIASDTGGLKELVEHGRTGLLVSKEDPDALANAILYLIENNEKLLELGKEASITVRTKYPLSQFIKKMEENYLKIAK